MARIQHVMLRGGAVGLALAMAAGGAAACDERASGSQGRLGVVASFDDLEPDAGVIPPPVRPADRYVMVRITDRCAIDRVAIDDKASSRVVADVACPKHMQLGEGIRLDGAICTRESKIADRDGLPVICPGTLLKAEKEGRAAALGSASAAPLSPPKK